MDRSNIPNKEVFKNGTWT